MLINYLAWKDSGCKSTLKKRLTDQIIGFRQNKYFQTQIARQIILKGDY